MTRRRTRYPKLGPHDPRLALAWCLLALGGLLAAVGAGAVAGWCCRWVAGR